MLTSRWFKLGVTNWNNQAVTDPLSGMNLEDDFCDIIKKARLGQEQTLAVIAQRTQIAEQELKLLEQGSRLPTRTEVQTLSQALGLRTQPLTNIAIDGWLPENLPSWTENDGLLLTVLGDIGGYEVKGYILSDSNTNQAVLIDTGYNPKKMLTTLKEHNLCLTGVCLTHGHADHAGGLDRILDEWPVPVYLGEGDYNLLPWKPPQHLLFIPQNGQNIFVGSLAVKCLATPGHTPGGFCYRVCEGKNELCFVGDTLFAGSVGRSNPFSLYSTHLSSVRNVVLQLTEEAVLLPGHGPATTVKEELAHNPFS